MAYVNKPELYLTEYFRIERDKCGLKNIRLRSLHAFNNQHFNLTYIDPYMTLNIGRDLELLTIRLLLMN